MEQKSFKNGQILYSRCDDGRVDMCVFKKKGQGQRKDIFFYCTNWSRLNPDGTIVFSFDLSTSDYLNGDKDIQWQLATYQQIENYGYEVHLNPKVQFPVIKAEKEAQEMGGCALVKRKVGRPITGARDNYICVPLNDEEKKLLVRHARALDTSMSTLIRTLIFQSLPQKN